MALQNVIAVDNGKVIGAQPLVWEPVNIDVAQSYQNKITILDNQSYRLGNLIVINFKFVSSADLPVGDTKLHNLPKPKTTITSTSTAIINIANNKSLDITMLKNGNIINTSSITANVNIEASAVYIADE